MELLRNATENLSRKPLWEMEPQVSVILREAIIIKVRRQAGRGLRFPSSFCFKWIANKPTKQQIASSKRCHWHWEEGRTQSSRQNGLASLLVLFEKCLQQGRGTRHTSINHMDLRSLVCSSDVIISYDPARIKQRLTGFITRHHTIWKR